MNRDELLSRVETLAGATRAKTFRAAAEWILVHRRTGIYATYNVIETGCFRGIPGDGQSTLIFAALAADENVLCTFRSIELDAAHIAQAKEHLTRNGADPTRVAFIQGDSVAKLREEHFIDFLYVDSFDCDLKNPFPSQRHQLAEIGAAYGGFQYPAAILMDDNLADCHGGKTGMSAAFLKERGWRLIADGYQLLWVKDSA